MLCKIADLLVEVPAAGGMASRCREYLWDGEGTADIVIRSELYCQNRCAADVGDDLIAYTQSAAQFFTQLLKYNGIYLHASCVELDGKAYLFSGDSGVGKSTHTRLWTSCYPEKARVFNDDKPALRYLNNRWFAYGVPWCGKDGINSNVRVPLAGICFLKQGTDNRICRLSNKDAVQRLIPQTLRKIKRTENLNLTLERIDKLVREIPIFELENRPEPEAARLSYETMCRGAEEAGL